MDNVISPTFIYCVKALDISSHMHKGALGVGYQFLDNVWQYAI